MAKRDEKIKALDEEIEKLKQEYQKHKAEYRRLVEWQMFGEYELGGEEGKTTDDKSIEAVFVTFKAMTGKSRCMTLFADAHMNAHADAAEN